MTNISEEWKKNKSEFLSRNDIEYRVNRMLKTFYPKKYGEIPQDLQSLMSILQSKCNMNFSYANNLGSFPDNKKILGTFMVDPYRISICSSIEPWSTLFKRTLAHEIGHFVLHRKMIGYGRYIPNEKQRADTDNSLRYGKMSEFSDLDWVEWQATEFAMCLILPREYIKKLVIKYQKKMGLIKNIGQMYLDDQPCNHSNCMKIVNDISEQSSIDTNLIWRRLRFLDILDDKRVQSY
jgi:hypothetical protein